MSLATSHGISLILRATYHGAASEVKYRQPIQRQEFVKTQEQPGKSSIKSQTQKSWQYASKNKINGKVDDSPHPPSFVNFSSKCFCVIYLRNTINTSRWANSFFLFYFHISLIYMCLCVLTNARNLNEFFSWLFTQVITFISVIDVFF